MLNEMPLLSVAKTAKLGSYAGFAGTGPFNTFCSGCDHQTPDGNKFVCAKYRALTGRKGSPISPGTASCRYFEKRRSFNAPVGG